MIRLIFLIAALTLAALGLSFLSNLDGALTVTMLGYRIETNLATGAAFVLVVAILIASLWSLLRFIFRIPELISLGLNNRRRARGRLAISRGMIAIGAGDALAARQNAEEAKRLLGPEPLTLLLAAQSAQLDGNRLKADRAFEEMLSDTETRLLGLRGLYIEAQRAGDLINAIRHADEALTFSSKAAWATEALIDYFVSQSDFDKALLALERGRAGFEKTRYKRMRAVVLTARGLAHEASDPDHAIKDAEEAAKLATTLVPAQTLLSRLLARRGDYRKASRGLETAWRLAPHPELAEAYLSVRPGDAARERMQRARKLQTLRNDHHESRLIVARAALEMREFDLARETLKPLTDAQPTMRVCLLMAEIETHDQNRTGLMREWLHRATHAPADEAWIGDGVALDHWQPLSPLTHRLDQVEWTTRPDPLAQDRASAILVSALRGLEHHAQKSDQSAALSARSFLDKQSDADATPVAPLPASKPRPSRGPVIFPLAQSPDDPGLVSDHDTDHEKA